MSKKIIYIILFCWFFLNACNNSYQKISLKESEKEWFNPYKFNKKILFKSENNIDTFVVGKISDYYSPCNRFELGEYQYNSMSVLLKPKNCHGTTYCSIILDFNKSLQRSKKEDCVKYFQVFDLWSKDISNLDPVTHYLHGNATTSLVNPIRNSFTYSFNYHLNTEGRTQRTGTYGARFLMSLKIMGLS